MCNKKKQNRYIVEEKSTRNDILDYSWCFKTTLDLMSQVESKFGANLVFADISILLKMLVKNVTQLNLEAYTH